MTLDADRLCRNHGFCISCITVCFQKHHALARTDGSFYRFVSYSAQAMLGVIIYDTAFARLDGPSLVQQFQILDALKLLLLVGTFAVVARTRKICRVSLPAC
jgi:hypothetical protein